MVESKIGELEAISMLTVMLDAELMFAGSVSLVFDAVTSVDADVSFLAVVSSKRLV